MGKSMVSCRFSLKPIHWLMPGKAPQRAGRSKPKKIQTAMNLSSEVTPGGIEVCGGASLQMFAVRIPRDSSSNDCWYAYIVWFSTWRSHRYQVISMPRQDSTRKKTFGGLLNRNRQRASRPNSSYISYHVSCPGKRIQQYSTLVSDVKQHLCHFVSNLCLWLIRWETLHTAMRSSWDPQFGLAFVAKSLPGNGASHWRLVGTWPQRDLYLAQ